MILAPFAAAVSDYPSSTPTAPTPPTTGNALEGITFGSDWSASTAKALSTGSDASGSGHADVNAVFEVCCPRTHSTEFVVGPGCTELTSGDCDDDETRHTLKGWEDSPFISYDGTILYYSHLQRDLAWLVGCIGPCYDGCVDAQGSGSEDLCLNTLCRIHCGEPVRSLPRDNESINSDLYETAIVSGAWSDKGSARTAVPDTTANERGVGVDHDGSHLVFARAIQPQSDPEHTDLYIAELDGGNPEAWDTPVAIPVAQGVAPINTVCNEDNPHILQDDGGLRLYFDSDRKWSDDGLWGIDQDDQPWDDADTDCDPAQRSIYVARKPDGGDWSDVWKVDLPAAVTTENWATDVRQNPWVSPKDPTEQVNQADRGMRIYWYGTEDDCYELSGSTKVPTGCVYMAEQDTSYDIDDPWDATSTATKVIQPRPVPLADFGEVPIVTDISITGNEEYLYFTYAVRDTLPADQEPPIDSSELLGAPGFGIFTEPKGVTFDWGNWKNPTALDHPANFKKNGDTSGWEDSTNISDDGRRLYFGYSRWIIGQGLFAGPDYCDPDDLENCIVGRRVVPRILASGSANTERDTSQAGAPPSGVVAGSGVSIYEAVIGDHDSNSATPNEWIVTFSPVNYASYCLQPGTNPGQCQGDPYSTQSECPHECITRDDFCLNDVYGEVLTTSSAECFTPADQGMNEAAPTVSRDDSGVDHMVFVRYGDLTKLDETNHLDSPPEAISARMLLVAKNCGSGSDEWCVPALAPFTIDDTAQGMTDDEKSCIDNDPHLTAGATSVYFDSNRGAAAGHCAYRDPRDSRVYHARKNCDSNGDPTDPIGQGSNWCKDAAEVVGGPNQVYVDIDENSGTGEKCEICATAPSLCPLPCTDDSGKFGKRVWGGSQAFVTEDESAMYFLGKGPECTFDATGTPPTVPPEDPGTEGIGYFGPCVYRSDRVNSIDPPEFADAFLVMQAQPQLHPCQEVPQGQSQNHDIGKVVGLGEPSVTKDGWLLYFVYQKKTATGTPLDPDTDLDYCQSGDDPSDPAEELCRCDEQNDIYPKGCWLPACYQTPGGTAGEDCKEVCRIEHIVGEQGLADECLPASVIFCKDPTKSQTATVDGVDVFEFGIGAARKEHWNVNVGVVQKSQQ